MRSIVHTRFGDPQKVLEIARRATPEPAKGRALVRMRFVPVHPGDTLSVQGSPAFGPRPPIPDGGITPGIEGVGVVAAIGEGDAGGLQPGARVAVGLTAGTWQEEVAVPFSSLVPLPDGLSDEVAAHMLVTTFTASLLVRTGLAIERSVTAGTPVIVTGAGSEVARVLTVLLEEQGITPIRLVHRAGGVSDLERRLPGSAIYATESDGWKGAVKAQVGDAPIPLAVDAVAGALLGDVADLVARGGTIINFGSLGSRDTDIRAIVPRGIRLQGASLGTWPDGGEATRKADIRTALRLAAERPELLAVDRVYPAAEFRQAISHAERPGKAGAVLIDLAEGTWGDGR